MSLRNKEFPRRGLTPIDLYWLAGYLEGEGCFSMAKPLPKRKYVLCFIAVSTTDRDVAERVARLMGCTVCEGKKQRSHHKVPYRTRVSGARAIGWMFTLYQLMGERRRARIQEVLRAWSDSSRPRQVRPAPCHPERRHRCGGLCHPCYQRQWRKRRAA